MATLTENANRIKNGAADIKDWILAQGVTPTGNIETFRAALDSIEINKVKVGTFTSSVTDVEVKCGFQPKSIIAFSGYEAGAFPSAAYYNINGSQKYVGARATSIGAGAVGLDLMPITSEGFTHKAPNNYYANLLTYYIAIG